MITNTNGSSIKEGVHQFEIVTAPAPVVVKGFDKMEFEFQIMGGMDKPFKMSFFDNQMTDLLRALGCNEIEAGVFDWDVMDVFGKQFSAEVYYEADKNGKINDKTGKVQSYRKLRNFKAVGQAQAKPSSNPDGVKTPADIHPDWKE
jgi:hypothetical protein